MSKQYGFIIDSGRCVDCRACLTACKSSHQAELGIAWRRVNTVWKGEFPAVSFRTVSMACNHCAEPACVANCPTQAITKRAEDGIVVVDKEKCVGCRICAEQCPYQAPQFGKDGTMQKCNLCQDRIGTGKQPVCVSTCSAGALIFGEMEELPKVAGGKVLKRLEGPTKPSVYIPAV